MEKWEKIKAVQQMQDYIEENIKNDITLHKLAKAAGYSPWHSARIFKEITSKAPFDYIRSIRLTAAAAQLDGGKARVADIAFDFVFDSHEGFTRAFSRQFGLNPNSYIKNKPSIKLFLPSRSKDYYYEKLIAGGKKLEKRNSARTVFVQVVQRPARKMILKRGIKATHYFEYCEEVGCDVWDILSQIKEALYEPAGLWLPENMVKPQTSIYAQGVEVPEDFSGTIPEDFEIISLKPCKLMVFQGQPFEDEKFADAIEELWEVIKDYDPKLYGFEWADEDAPRMQLEPLGYRGYIEAKPVRDITKKD